MPRRLDYELATQQRLLQMHPALFDIEATKTTMERERSDVGYLDLAFGQILGTGSFSKVRSCKVITKARPQFLSPDDRFIHI